MFSPPALRSLAKVAEERILADVAEMPDAEKVRLLAETPPAPDPR